MQRAAGRRGGAGRGARRRPQSSLGRRPARTCPGPALPMRKPRMPSARPACSRPSLARDC
ncbi:hypothetical protein JYU34_020059 [Plutella xylostella]|uniref:Uncharacterized protein n=1 Tax=Plutella xylostella TaxID=51655 RepID=A0ABQ7PVV1_PLUXY|nr:hypothetical protein JYU34_020059 [Plutella xylostella]